VVAAILHKALGKQLHCILIDNGLLRKNEARTISQHFQQHFQNESQLRVVDASEQFLSGLENVSDPQQKRKIIGELFIRAFEQATNEIDNVQFLAQGTLYPDIIESGAAIDGPAAVIKSHHNVGGLPDDLRLQLIEPLRDLFKDEVRALGKQLGLPEAIINRHPFPGPGLAVRCLSPITQTNLDIIRQADAILLEQLNINNLYHLIDQAFTVLLPVKSVGVMGDNRTYEQTICIRCVNTQDFMTADWSKIDYNILAKISSQTINQVNGVNRVVYDISSKPPATIEWE
jgi:GMP synthase (glutamine-hydrolysing)